MKKLNVEKVLGTKAIEKVVADEALSKSAKVKALFDGGMEVKAIAAALDIRYNFAYNVISNYIIVNEIEVETGRKASKKDAVWALLDEGKSAKEIAVELKTNYNYVYKLKKDWATKAMEEVVTEEVAK